MLNNYMNEKHPLQTIYEELLEMKIVENQLDFSVMCGRTTAWFSCIKARRLPITSDAALTLAFKLRRKANKLICPIKHQRLTGISDRLLEHAENQVMKKAEVMDKWRGQNESV